mmetsp:Transcript_16073/g.62706  ORF Transcript_16073/g.62706 Transcript_16073/m.62706 type:complete len:238 (-) Transcript_16073:50-763(-)
MDRWLQTYEKAVDLADKAEQQLADRVAAVRAGGIGGGEINEYSNKVILSLKHLDNHMLQLQDDLELMARDPITYHVTEAELKRREVILATLGNRKKVLTDKLYADPIKQASARDALLSGGNKKRAWGETAATKDLHNAGVLEYNKRRMEEQDETIKNLGRVMTNVEGVAVDIGKEADEHTQLLNRMQPKVEKTTARVANESNRAITFQQKATTGGLWVVIFILFVIIIVLALITILL